MTDRDAAIARFLAGTPAADWTRVALHGDASTRRYARLLGPGRQSAILMDVGPGGAMAAFKAIALHLAGLGLCPPAILAEQPEAGLYLLDDLGGDTFVTWLDETPADALPLYATALDAMLRLQEAPPPPGLVPLVPTRAAGMIAPLFDAYAPGTAAPVAARIIGTLQAALGLHAPRAETLALRDFHAGNLIWRPDRQGTDRVGLLDFQDAVLAAPEYDLISLLRDARRDVSAEVRIATIDRYAALTGRPIAPVLAACAVLGAQRNLRILGIFARLVRVEGKTRYLALLPRVWQHVVEELEHPALRELAPLIAQGLPAPDKAISRWALS